MPQVHIHQVRYGVSRESVASALQQYTGMGLIEARRAAREAVSGRPVSLYVEDFSDVYELADLLTGLGLEAEADESDESRFQ
jgi:DNA-binding FadR family transcriptional regulator